jgi:hypothetical protein
LFARLRGRAANVAGIGTTALRNTA